MLRTRLVMLLLLICTTSGSDFVSKLFAYFLFYISCRAGLNYILTNKERGKGGFCVSNISDATIAPIYDLGSCKQYFNFPCVRLKPF
jgi:hypothetical protein